MIKTQVNGWPSRWIYVLLVVALCSAAASYWTLDRNPETPNTTEPYGMAPQETQDARGTETDDSVTSARAGTTAPQEGVSGEDRSNALETGMEDWQKPENVALHAELQRWYDHREESTLEQRRADASALMAKVEARQAAGKLSETSAALGKLMLLQGAPSDDPQHAARLQEVMTLLAGRLSFGE